MSKSFDFCKAAVQDASRSNYTDRSWDNAGEDYETEAIFDEFIRGARSFYITGKLDDGTDVKINIGISFDGDADFDYFTSSTCVHDGTLFFVREAMDECVRNVCTARTYNKNIGAPGHGDNIRYVVGNFVVLTEYDGDFVPDDKPWMRERTTVLLPLKMMKG